ncbi:MAG TPA: hypothetical protein VGM20_13410 [Gemmatimonadales bacterium]
MYHTCLYCEADLGRNEVIEPLPVGSRLAFDAGRGRLWIICTSCVKWNLVPFDSRLEAIDCCERVFRDTRARFSTDHIGLASHRSGADLIRIGPALRPEFAAWRYGSMLRRRRRMPRAETDAAGVLNWVMTALWSGPFDSLPFFQVTGGAVRAMHQHCVLRDPWTDQLVDVPFVALMLASLSANSHGDWRLEVPYRSGAEHVGGAALPSIRDVPTLGLFAGAALLPTLGRVLPAIDHEAAARAQVAEATRLLETAGSEQRLLEYVVGRPLRFATQRQYILRDVPFEVRLALEMAAHEETERRAMEGELKLLERQWRDAEDLAAIADRLALEHGG